MKLENETIYKEIKSMIKKLKLYLKFYSELQLQNKYSAKYIAVIGFLENSINSLNDLKKFMSINNLFYVIKRKNVLSFEPLADVDVSEDLKIVEDSPSENIKLFEGLFLDKSSNIEENVTDEKTSEEK